MASPPSGSTLSPTFHVETYGCGANEADTEIVSAILQAAGLAPSPDPHGADVALLMTCSIREGAEARVIARLKALKAERARARPSARARARAARAGAPLPPAPPPLLGVLGCMAERLRGRLVADGLADLVAGPDAYRGLPRLLDAAVAAAAGGEGVATAALAPTTTPAPPASPKTPSSASAVVDVALSRTEDYADIKPVRDASSPLARLAISRGCDSHCAFCIVPSVRGAERSRGLAGLVSEASRLFHEGGVREILLLGQNVTSWVDWTAVGPPEAALAAQRAARAAARADPAAATAAAFAPGFSAVLLPTRRAAGGRATHDAPALPADFADLLAGVASISPELRVRFSSPHPRDFTRRLIEAVADHPNVARSVHLPAQSGASTVLERMNRGYSRAAYDALVASVRAGVPGVGVSTDIIVGFCGETEAEHAATLDLLRAHAYDAAFLFSYSVRPRTRAARTMADDVPPDVKARRLAEAVAAYRHGLAARSAEEAGRSHLVLVEGPARKQPAAGAEERLLTGRTSTGRRVLFPAAAGLAPGGYAEVAVTEGRAGSLRGRVVRATTAGEWFRAHGGAAWVVEAPQQERGRAAAAAV